MSLTRLYQVSGTQQQLLPSQLGLTRSPTSCFLLITQQFAFNCQGKEELRGEHRSASRARSRSAGDQDPIVPLPQGNDRERAPALFVSSALLASSPCFLGVLGRARGCTIEQLLSLSTVHMMTVRESSFDNDLDTRWRSVKARLSAVFQNMQDTPVKTSPEEWSNIFTDVANLYGQNDAMLLRRMYVHVRQFVRDLVEVQLHHLRILDGTILLSEYVRRWKVAMKYIMFMKRVLHHLQRSWIKENTNSLKHDPVRPLDKLLMFYWREDLLSNLPSIVDIALDLVDDDRRGISINREAVRGVVENFVEIGAADVCEHEMYDSIGCSDKLSPDQISTLHLYIHVFEDRFLSRTRSFYKEEGARIARDGNITTFVKQIQSHLDAEEARVRNLLHDDSTARVRQAAEAELIGNHKEYLQKEATTMIREGRTGELRVVFKLLERVEEGLTPIGNFFVSFVRDEGNSLVVKHIDSLRGKGTILQNLTLVERLISLYWKHAKMAERCFEGSNMIMIAIDNAFRGFVNRSLGPICLANLLAHYIDRLLRPKAMDGVYLADEYDECSESKIGSFDRQSGTVLHLHKLKCLAPEIFDNNQGLPSVRDDLQRERLMNELVRLFGYLDDKDIFFETHRRLFAKRLLYGSKGEMENVFIGKLRQKAGNTYTQRLTGMLQDVIVGKALRGRFTSYLGALRVHYWEKQREQQLKSCTVESEHALSLSEIQEILLQESEKFGGIPAYIQDWFKENASKGTATWDRQGIYILRRLRQCIPRLERNLIGLPNPQSGSTLWMSKLSTNGGVLDEEDNIAQALQIDFNGYVFNALHWPPEKKLDLKMPSVLTKCQQLFSQFYMRNKKPRKLTWVHSSSTIHLTARIGTAEYTFVVSALQACFLLLLNDRDCISVKDAARYLNVSSQDLLEHLEPMTSSRTQRLLMINDHVFPHRFAAPHAVKPQQGVESSIPPFGMSQAQEPAEKASNKGLSSSILLGDVKKRKMPSICLTEPPPLKRQRFSLNSSGSSSNFEIQSTATDRNGDVKLQLPSVRQILAAAPIPCPLSAVHPLHRAHLPPQSVESSCKRPTHTSKGSSYIHLNKDFESRYRKIIFPSEMSKIAAAKAKVTRNNVVMDRNTQIDAVLVRVMKSRKQATYGELCAEVISALSKQHFMPDPKVIKKRLERLIDQEYIARDENDSKLYTYNA
ncbi:Cullin [Gracilaria domingensis]|nr:Cullin [Gracilaria domingensis]